MSDVRRRSTGAAWSGHVLTHACMMRGGGGPTRQPQLCLPPRRLLLSFCVPAAAAQRSGRVASRRACCSRLPARLGGCTGHRGSRRFPVRLGTMPAPDAASAPLLPRNEVSSSPKHGALGTPWGTYRSVAFSALAPLSVGYVLGYTSPTAAALLASGVLTPPQLSVFEALSPLVRARARPPQALAVNTRAVAAPRRRALTRARLVPATHRRARSWAQLRLAWRPIGSAARAHSRCLARPSLWAGCWWPPPATPTPCSWADYSRARARAQC